MLKYCKTEGYNDITIDLEEENKRKMIILRPKKDIGEEYWFEYDGVTVRWILKPSDEIDFASLVHKIPTKMN